MINLRYHIVSLIAVFLALGLGIVAGSTVVDQGIVKVLRQQTEVLREQRDEANAARRTEQNAVAAWEAVAGPLVDDLLSARLSGVPVVLLVENDVPEALADAIDASVASADGEAAGIIRFSDRWAAPTEAMRRDVADVVGSKRSGTAAILEDVAVALASRLARPANVEGDLLDNLAKRNLIDIDRPTDAEAFPPAASIVVYVTGSSDAPSPAHATFAIPFLRATLGKTLAAVAEPLSAHVSLTEAVRGSSELAPEIVTVDHVDTLPGRYALVEDLRDLLAGEGAGHHGVRRRTDGIGPTR